MGDGVPETGNWRLLAAFFPGGSADTCANVLATGVGALTWRNCMAVEYSMRLNDELQTRTGDGGRVKKNERNNILQLY